MEQSAQVRTDIESCKNCCLIIVGNCIYFCDFLLRESFSRPHQSSQCCHSAVWVFRIWLPKLNAQRSFQLKYNFTGQCFMVIVALSGRLLKFGLLAEGIGGNGIICWCYHYHDFIFFVGNMIIFLIVYDDLPSWLRKREHSTAHLPIVNTCKCEC